jgi:hypothetical protein
VAGYPPAPAGKASGVGRALILVIYGGVLSLTGWLVQAGIVPAAANADHEALGWHTYLWDPWFLVWGLLLAPRAGPLTPDQA